PASTFPLLTPPQTTTASYTTSPAEQSPGQKLHRLSLRPSGCRLRSRAVGRTPAGRAGAILGGGRSGAVRCVLTARRLRASFVARPGGRFLAARFPRRGWRCE